MNNELFFFFFTAKWDQCMQVLLAGTAARVPTSSSDRKRKTKKKKNEMVKSPNWVLSHFLLGWFHRSRAASPQVTTTLWLQGSADNAQPFAAFLIFQSVARVEKKEEKKDVWHQPCTLYFNTMWCMTVRRKEKKQTNKTKAKVKFPVYRFACVLTLCCTSRAGRPSFCFFFVFFLNSLKRESSLTQVAPRLPLKRAACDDGQPTGFLFFGKREEDRQTDRPAQRPSLRPSCPTAPNLQINSSGWWWGEREGLL